MARVLSTAFLVALLAATTATFALTAGGSLELPTHVTIVAPVPFTRATKGELSPRPSHVEAVGRATSPLAVFA